MKNTLGVHRKGQRRCEHTEMTVWLERCSTREEWRWLYRVQLCTPNKCRKRDSGSSRCRGRPSEDGRREPETEKHKANTPPSIDQWHHHLCPHSPWLEISVMFASSFTPLTRHIWSPSRSSTGIIAEPPTPSSHSAQWLSYLICFPKSRR